MACVCCMPECDNPCACEETVCIYHLMEAITNENRQEEQAGPPAADAVT
ncbi:MAG: hypothetical protein PHI12_08630 [Dehalococcoidales bacterium]|nr:hypothetical protein [Dehalococcoidales bacterium]